MIIIFPFAKNLRNGSLHHPKNYPYWKDLIPLIKEIDSNIIQVGIDGEEDLSTGDFRKNLSLPKLSKIILESDTWIGVDSFGQHLCWDLGKRGIVLWGQSDPLIFGHHENINLLKSRQSLRENQFWMWEQTNYDPSVFVQPEEVIEALNKLLSTK